MRGGIALCSPAAMSVLVALSVSALAALQGKAIHLPVLATDPSRQRSATQTPQRHGKEAATEERHGNDTTTARQRCRQSAAKVHNRIAKTRVHGERNKQVTAVSKHCESAAQMPLILARVFQPISAYPLADSGSLQCRRAGVHSARTMSPKKAP